MQSVSFSTKLNYLANNLERIQYMINTVCKGNTSQNSVICSTLANRTLNSVEDLRGLSIHQIDMLYEQLRMINL